MHVRAAQRNGLTSQELKGVFLQPAIYRGVPAAACAFVLAQPIIDAWLDGEADASDEG